MKRGCSHVVLVSPPSECEWSTAVVWNKVRLCSVIDRVTLTFDLSTRNHPKFIPCTKFKQFVIIRFWTVLRTNRHNTFNSIVLILAHPVDCTVYRLDIGVGHYWWFVWILRYSTITGHRWSRHVILCTVAGCDWQENPLSEDGDAGAWTAREVYGTFHIVSMCV